MLMIFLSCQQLFCFVQRDRHDLIEEYERSLFRLLHCYILDKIKLHPEDVAQVERAFDKQLQAIALLEDAILMHRRLAEQSFIELRELQESRILPFFHHIVANGGCTKQTISLLRENVSRDLRKITSDVSIFNFQFIDMMVIVQINSTFFCLC